MTAEGNADELWQIAVTIHGNHHLMRLLRRPGGVAAWNRMVRKMAAMNILGAAWRPGEEPPLVAAIDFSRAVLPPRLDGIDLTYAWLGGADLSHRLLRNAIIGCCPGADLSGSDISGATFLGDISGADFCGCVVSDGTDLRLASYSKSDPPRGLILIDLCKADDWSQPTGRPGRLPYVRLRAEVNLLDLAPFIAQEPGGFDPQ